LVACALLNICDEAHRIVRMSIDALIMPRAHDDVYTWAPLLPHAWCRPLQVHAVAAVLSKGRTSGHQQEDGCHRGYFCAAANPRAWQAAWKG
jgi:hypothetical protein